MYNTVEVDKFIPVVSSTEKRANQKKEKFLPLIMLANIQSFGKSESKDKTLETEVIMKSNNVEIAVFSETWLTDDVVDRLPFNGYQKFHLLRKKANRSSGGVSIFVKNTLPATRLNIQVPDDMECVWTTIRPNWLPRSVSNIIVCGLYYPGITSVYAPNQKDLIFHIIASVEYLKGVYASPLFLILGDFNDLPIKSICKTCGMKQVVDVPTRGDATLDLILTNFSNDFYEKPISLPKIGEGDHFPVLYKAKRYLPPKDIKQFIEIRRFPKSAIMQFGAWITSFDWRLLSLIPDVDDRIIFFSTLTWRMINIFFPLKKVRIPSTDREWITPKIKELIAKRQKAHMVRNFELRDSLHKMVKLEVKLAKIEYNKSRNNYFKNLNPKEWYRHVHNIISNGKSEINLSNIPELAQKTPAEQTVIINEYFANICRKYPKLQFDYIANEMTDISHIPEVSELDTYRMLVKFSKKSPGPKDFPKKILQTFAVELAVPFCNIINYAIEVGVFPREYKKTEIIPIPKINPPQSLSDLRPISKTPIGGKMIETIIMKELDKDIKGKLDTDQYGNVKGSSTTHYLIKMTNEAFTSMNRGDATTAVTIDYSKAFDYVDHSILIEKLVNLRVRSNIINMIISFLKDRSHCTKALGKISTFLDITCGVPQGTCSGPKLFVILIDGKKCPLVSSYKFVDDKTISYSYSGDPTEILQTALNVEAKETHKDKMLINAKKCHVITFNNSQKNIEPQNLLLDGNIIQSCKKIKLLGVIISNDLKWSENTESICSKVSRKLFMLGKLKKFGLKTEELVIAWKTMLRPLTEYAAPLWHSGLTDADDKAIEDLQKKALAIILRVVFVENRKLYKLNNKIIRYEEVLEKLGLETLSDRREILTGKFALQLVQSERHKDMIETKVKTYNTRSNNRFVELNCNSKRSFMSAVPYMTRLLNGVRYSKTK